LPETLASHGEYHPAAFENLTGHGETLIAGWETLVARAETCFPAGKMSVLTQYRETGTTTWLNGPVCTPPSIFDAQQASAFSTACSGFV